MLPLVKLYLERAENEVILAEAIFNISSRDNLKQTLNLGSETFYSAVISHCYYCIFYCAKAILLVQGIKTKSPGEHDKTYKGFKGLVSSGFIDKKLFEIYEEEIVKAESLLSIFSKEKSKRGMFTYRKLPQANINPAMASLKNASFFFKNINVIIKKQDEILERQNKAIEYMGTKGRITRKEYAELNECTEITAKRDLNDFVKKGVTRRIGKTGKYTYYILNFNGSSNGSSNNGLIQDENNIERGDKK